MDNTSLGTLCSCGCEWGDHSSKKPHRCKGCDKCLSFYQPLHRISDYERINGRLVRKVG